MIGGGDLASFPDGATLDQELFVRFAQCSALFPMMQFSLAPWRVLDERHLRSSPGRRADAAGVGALPVESSSIMPPSTGEPILRPLAYHFAGYEAVHDQFLLGEEILCAPVLEPGATTRPVLVPPGRWLGSDGSVTSGPAEFVLEVHLESMPYWRKIN